MSSTRPNKFLSTRYLEYRLEDEHNVNGDTRSFFQAPFQCSFLILPNQDLSQDYPQLESKIVLKLPLGSYNTCVWRLATYCPTVYPLASIFDSTWSIHARSGTIHFDNQESTSGTAVSANLHMDIFHSNVVCEPPAAGTEYPESSITWFPNLNSINTELRAVYNQGDIDIQLNKWIRISRVKGHLTIF